MLIDATLCHTTFINQTMRTFIRIALLALFGTFVTSNIQAKGNEKQVYAFAFGTCFNDSIVYFSAISQIPDGQLEAKTKFLYNRLAYSNQFKHYLDSQNGQPHTCAIFFSTKKEKLQKKYAKLCLKYGKDKQKRLTEVTASDFEFRPINNQ